MRHELLDGRRLPLARPVEQRRQWVGGRGGHGASIAAAIGRGNGIRPDRAARVVYSSVNWIILRYFTAAPFSVAGWYFQCSAWSASAAS